MSGPQILTLRGNNKGKASGLLVSKCIAHVQPSISPLVIHMAWIKCVLHERGRVVDQEALSWTIHHAFAVDQNAINAAAQCQ